MKKKKVKKLPYDPSDIHLVEYMKRQPKTLDDDRFISVPEPGAIEVDLTQYPMFIDFEHEDPNDLEHSFDFRVRNFKVPEKVKGRKRVSLRTPGSNSRAKAHMGIYLEFIKGPK